jgi:hypothetical protein
MYKYLIAMLLFTGIAVASNGEVASVREQVSGTLNQAVLEMKTMFRKSNEELDGVEVKNTSNKARVDQLKSKAEDTESNPTVLDHAKKAIPNCDYSSKNLVWDGSSWKCIKMNVDTECQAAAPDEYMYTNSSGNKICAKSPKGVAINYFYEFRAYSSKCTGAYKGYEKLYDCKYRNKLGQKIEVASSYCSSKSKPVVANKLCSKGWTVNSWGKCSKTCGGGKMTRSVYCQAGYDCSMYKKPIASQSCNTQKCKGDWVKGSWSRCSATACGTSGKQTRSVYCPSHLDCSGKKKPSTTQNCSTAACPVCTWGTGSWGKCSTSKCGSTGVKTRSVWKSGPSNCVGPYTPKPSSTTSCSTSACPTCTWGVGSWGKCSVTKCGSTGTKTRSVWKSGPSNCVGPKTAKPSTSQSCSTAACPTCKWSTGSWSSCSAKACGTSGTKTRSVWKSGPSGCVGPYTAKPSTSTKCYAPKCTYTYAWSYGGWGRCSATKCGTSGKQTRSYSCKRSDGRTVANSNCSGKPYYQKTCYAAKCTYKLSVSGWNKCNATCGGGTQKRTATCKRSDGVSVSMSYCGGSVSTSRSCNTHSCITYRWYTGSWQSRTCANPQRHRVVYCKSSTGARVSDSNCPGSKPSTTKGPINRNWIKDYCYGGGR